MGPKAVSDIVFNSGTSGHPLAARLTHDMVLRSAYGSAFHRAFADGWRASFALPNWSKSAFGTKELRYEHRALLAARLQRTNPDHPTGRPRAGNSNHIHLFSLNTV